MSGNKYTKEYYIAELRNPTPRSGQLAPLLAIEQGTFYVGGHVGMGNFDATPLHRCRKGLRDAIMTLFESGELRQEGKPFTGYPGSPLFVHLAIKTSSS